MPIIKPTATTAPIDYPKKDFHIVKYLDLTKYISLLQQKSLFFCRFDKLEDQYEGITSKANFPHRVSFLKDLSNTGFFNSQMTDDRIVENVKKQYENEKLSKSVFCVNCWNIFIHESAALWKIYSDFSKGIMIKSSVSKIEKAFHKTEEDIQLSIVHYLDKNKDIEPDGNINYNKWHKHIAYKYEEEIRLIYQLDNSIDWTKEEVEEGKYIKIEMDDLIDEIIIGPYSPKWFFELVQNISRKYGLKQNIERSSLSL